MKFIIRLVWTYSLLLCFCVGRSVACDEINAAISPTEEEGKQEETEQEENKRIIDERKNRETLVMVSIGKEQKISIFSMSPGDQKLLFKSETQLAGSPSAMCVDRDGQHLYAVVKKTGNDRRL